MPTYEYRCPAGHEFENFVLKISAAKTELPCPTCGVVAPRRMSAGSGLLFKGSGFYITDYGKDGKKDQRPAAKSEGGAESGAKGDSGKAPAAAPAAASGGEGKSSAAAPASGSASTSGGSSTSGSGSSSSSATAKPASKPSPKSGSSE